MGLLKGHSLHLMLSRLHNHSVRRLLPLRHLLLLWLLRLLCPWLILLWLR